MLTGRTALVSPVTPLAMTQSGRGSVFIHPKRREVKPWVLEPAISSIARNVYLDHDNSMPPFDNAHDNSMLGFDNGSHSPFHGLLFTHIEIYINLPTLLLLVLSLQQLFCSYTICYFHQTSIFKSTSFCFSHPLLFVVAGLHHNTPSTPNLRHPLHHVTYPIHP